MKLFICCLVGSLFYVALADVKKSDEISVSKPKRDASLPSALYHGPSYTYLPPSTLTSTYDTYAGKVGSYAGYSGGHISGIGGAYRTGSSSHDHGHGHRYRGYPSTGNRNIAVYHNLENEPALNYNGGHHGYKYPSTNHYTGQGSTQFIRPGYKADSASHFGGAKLGPSEFHISRPHTFAFANGNSFGTNAASGGGYHYTKGGSFSSPASTTEYQSADGLASSIGVGSHEEHHGDHVHNGAQEHVYVISNIPNIPAGFANSYDAKETSIHQHPLPSAAGASFNTKYYSQDSEHGPVYASGHKGLRHFGFTANKPQVLHASLAGPSFQQPSYSKAPFKPSTFLGAKFEDSLNGDVQPQQYLPPLEENHDSTGYDYPLPTETYQ